MVVAERKLAEASAAYENLQELDIPHSVKEASESGWTLAFDALSLGLKLHYDEDLRLQDRTRVVPLARVLSILSAYEESLVRSQVEDGAQIFWGKLTAIYDALKAVIRNIDWLTLIGDPVTAVSVIVGFVLHSITYTWTAVSFAVYQSQVKSAFVTRDELEAKLRKAALPQAKGPRYRRRKISRR